MCSFATSRLIYIAFKADLKARKQCHLLRQYYLCRSLCDRCGAIQPFTSTPHPMSYKNMAKDAPYSRTCINHSDYILQAREISPWQAVPGWSFETLPYDFMHLVYLGVAKNHVPSCLKILKLWGYHYEEGESNEQFLRRTSFEMKDDCKRKKFPVMRLRGPELDIQYITW